MFAPMAPVDIVLLKTNNDDVRYLIECVLPTSVIAEMVCFARVVLKSYFCICY